MRVLAPGIERKDVGGGGTFLHNLQKGLKQFFGVELVSEGDYDILLIAGASLCKREVVEEACEKGKKVILRIDNLLEDSRNKNTGMTRIREFAKFCDVVVYQSKWAKRLMKPYCGDGMVIYNGVDTDVFFPREKKKDWEDVRIFYSKFSRNEVKNFSNVQYFFRDYWLDSDNATLVLVGKFNDETRRIDHPFEFHNDERWEYKGVITDKKEMADVMRGCDVAYLPYDFDACSNTILECLACGLPVLHHDTGGTPEIAEMIGGYSYDYMETAYWNVNRVLQTCEVNQKELKEKFGLEKMTGEYYKLFKLLQSGTHEIEG